MQNVTVRLNEDYVETLDSEALDLNLSRAEYIRDLIEKGREADELREELEQTEAQLEELRRQLQARNAREDDIGELVNYVENERELRRERERRADAPVWRRAKWWVFGRDRETDEES